MKMNMKILLLLFVFLSPVYAQEGEMARESWLEAMGNMLPAAFCTPGGYFTECFSVSPEECQALARTATRTCMDQKKGEIPAVLNMPGDGSSWGAVLGNCAGEAYESTLVGQGKRIASEQCDDPSNWIP